MRKLWFVFVCWLVGLPCLHAREITVIPMPASSTVAKGVFVCRPDTMIHAGPGAHDVAEQLARYIRTPTGYAFPVVDRRIGKENGIELAIEPSLSRLGKEGYRLEVNSHRIVIHASAPAGLFYGVQTLRQLLPPAIYSAAKWSGVAWTVPSVSIEDVPRLEWRGAMVDVARRFVPKADLFRFIDAMAMLKLNHLHLHLTDNQGWHIEIRKYPQLTAQPTDTLEVQAQSGFNCGLQGGFYTQDDLRQIVAYAGARYITVIPEIEMPGHAGDAVSALPEMGNLDAWMGPEKGAPYRYRVFNPQEKTILFLQDVLSEVLDVFPSEYVHVGGDEVRKDEWQNSPSARARMRQLGLKTPDEVESYMVGRMQKFLESRGRRLIGWSDIMQGGLSKKATVMAGNMKLADSAVRDGYDVVMTPSKYTYFDYYQSHDPQEPRSHHYYLPLKTAYAFDPVPPGLTAAQARKVLGAQGQLWTLYMPTPYQLEYMAFPRLAALAEDVWTPAANKNYDSFKSRLLTQQQRWSIMGVNFRPLNSTTDR